jgi:hypothetical protein
MRLHPTYTDKEMRDSGYVLWETTFTVGFFADDVLQLVIGKECGHAVMRRVDGKLQQYLVDDKCALCVHHHNRVSGGAK